MVLKLGGGCKGILMINLSEIKVGGKWKGKNEMLKVYVLIYGVDEGGVNIIGVKRFQKLKKLVIDGIDEVFFIFVFSSDSIGNG